MNDSIQEDYDIYCLIEKNFQSLILWKRIQKNIIRSFLIIVIAFLEEDWKKLIRLKNKSIINNEFEIKTFFNRNKQKIDLFTNDFFIKSNIDKNLLERKLKYRDYQVMVSYLTSKDIRNQIIHRGFYEISYTSSIKDIYDIYINTSKLITKISKIVSIT